MPANTSRLRLPYPLSTDAPNGASQMQSLADALDTIITAYTSGTAASRPSTPSTGAGTLYEATDTGVLTFYNGTSWVGFGGAVAKGTEVAISVANTWQTIATITPTATDLYVVRAAAVVPSGGSNLGVQVTYADATGAQTLALLPVQSQAAGPWASLSALIPAHSGTAINVQVQSGSTATTASAAIEAL